MGFFKVKNLFGFLVIVALPAATFAVTRPVCKCGPVSPESYTWNFSKEAEGLLKQVNVDAYRVASLADTVNSFDFEREYVSWQDDASLLSREKARVNDMDQKLCRLRLIERVLPANQKAEINSIEPAIIEATDTTQAAITYLARHEDQVIFPKYEAFAPEIAADAARIQTATSNAG